MFVFRGDMSSRNAIDMEVLCGRPAGQERIKSFDLRKSFIFSLHSVRVWVCEACAQVAR